MVLWFFVIVCLATAFACDSERCGEGWTRNCETNSCYRIVFQKVNWTTARTLCTSFGHDSDLVSIHSSNESDFVTDLLKNNTQNKNVYWTWFGGYKINKTGPTFAWTDGSQTNFSLWMKGYPNTHVYPTATYLAVTRYGNWEWFNQKAEELVPSVLCKKPVHCADGWIEDQETGLCIKILEKEMNWETAKTTCASLAKGSQLVSLTTVQESKFVRDAMKKANSKTKGFWTGGSLSWVWTDESQVSVDVYPNDEPKKCLAVLKNADYSLKSVNCAKKNIPVCMTEK